MFQRDVLQQITRGFDRGSKVHIVLSEFAETMLEPMIERYSLYPAKGTTDARYAHNSDQMMLTHILNGLFPTLILAHEAQKRQLPRLSRLEVEELKVYVLAYSMHDLDKILGDGEKFGTRTRAATAHAYQKTIAELERLNARVFLPTVDNWISEILWLAVNTQRSRDINLSHTTFISYEDTHLTDEIIEILRPQTQRFRTRTESILRDLCTLSDLMAYFVKSPEDALLSNAATRSGGILDLIRQLTDDGTGHTFTLAYHKLAEVRGLLSNQINNATIRYLCGLDKEEEDAGLIPYLYFPNGVVYLDPQNRRIPDLDSKAIYAAVRQEIQASCRDVIAEGMGFGFDPKSLLKYPRYVHDFLTVKEFLNLFIQKTLSESGPHVAQSTLQAMRALQAKNSIPVHIALDYVPDKRITQLGRFLINYLKLIEKHLGKVAPQLRAEIEQRLTRRIGEDFWNNAQQIPSSGGVDYRLFWLAAQYLAIHPLASYKSESPGNSLEDLFQQCIDDLLDVAGKEIEEAPDLQGQYLENMALYVDTNLSFGFGTQTQTQPMPNVADELTRYMEAKKSRQDQSSCTICNSAYPTRKQEEASVLFQPWVYKNRLLLYKGENAGGICVICSLELMLRQILLKDKSGEQGRLLVTGKDYEDLELKYFFLYPNFFFTHQTYHLADCIITKMKNLKLYEVYTVFREKEHLSVADILHLGIFNLTQEELKAEKRSEAEEKAEQEGKGGMYLFERYEQKQYPGFLFFAKKTFKPIKKKQSSQSKATTASWVEATWLGLALPLIISARVVVTEEYLPLYHSAADFKETVILDAPHQAIRHLLPLTSSRLRLDQLYGSRAKEGDQIGGMMAAFSRAIELHIDTERSGGDLKLERFTRIARDLESDHLFTYSFLKEQLRRDKLDTIPGKKAYHYNSIYHLFVSHYHSSKGAIMTHIATRHERVTDLYLQFYLPFNDKGSWPNSHAIVRPIDIAANSIIRDTLNLTPQEIQLEMIAALKAWLEIVDKKGATGRVIAHGEKQDRLIRQFVETFYNEVFLGYAEGQRSLLNNRLNRFKGGCEQVFSMRMYQRRQETSVPLVAESPAEETAIVNGNSQND